MQHLMPPTTPGKPPLQLTTQRQSEISTRLISTNEKKRARSREDTQASSSNPRLLVDFLSIQSSPNLEQHGFIKSLDSHNRKKAKNKHRPQVTLIKKIGAGGSSSIYSCYVNDLVCAVKRVPLCGNEHGRTQEVKILDLLPEHPNIVQYLFFNSHTKYIDIFFKLYQRGLDSIITEKRENGEVFSVEELLDILRDVARGLSFLHRQKVIHRDIKSFNIFVEESFDGNRKYVIGDFDSAKIISNKSKPVSMIGTPSFMAPEIVKGRGECKYSRSIDVFAFGMLIYELLSLQLPFHDIKHFNIMSEIINGNRPVLPDDLPESVQPFVLLYRQCVSQSPSARPSARKLERKIEEIAKSLNKC